MEEKRPPPSEPGTPPSATPFPPRSPEEEAELNRMAANLRFLRAHGHLRMKPPDPPEPPEEDE